jgi:AcrR family transcriptional regulator
VSAQHRLLDAAERLIAERGLQVPLRDIALEAGQRNNSAVQYHFGGRDGLIEAVIRRRMAALEAERLELLLAHEASLDGDEIRGLVDILLRPLAELPYQQGATHYARFLEQARTHPLLSGQFGDEWRATRIIVDRLDRALADFPARARRQRLLALATTQFALLADRERATEASQPAVPVDDLISMLVALVTAPVPSRAGAR